MVTLVDGFGFHFLVLGLRCIPPDSWMQILVSLNALLVIGFNLVRVMEYSYLELKMDRLLRERPDF